MSVTSFSERNPVEELAEEFLARCRRGERPPLSDTASIVPFVPEALGSADERSDLPLRQMRD
jgi:hypothetical protein